MQTVAIVGVGLIGGSFARALRKHGFQGRILGVSSESTLRRALDLAIIDEGLAPAAALPRADLVLLAQPVARILRDLEVLGPHLRAGALVTDVGSTKRQIVATGDKHITQGIFLGGHPMAGKEVRGVEHSDPDLFRQRTWFLAPSRPETLEIPAVGAFVQWIREIGAVPVPIAADEHDRLVSMTSHLPQLLSTTLAALLSETLDTRTAAAASGPGLFDMTRLALSDQEIWGDILATNSDAIGAALDGFLDRLTALRWQLSASASTDPDLGREFEIASNFARLLREIHR